MRHRRGILLSVLMTVSTAMVVLAAGCSSGRGYYGPARLDQPFWTGPPRHVDIVLFSAPDGAIYRDGGSRLYHAYVTEARDTPLELYLRDKSLDYQWIAEHFALLMEDRGFSVKRIESGDLVLNRLSLFEFPGFPYAVRSGPDGVPGGDLLLVIRPGAWGLLRAYLGVVPVTPHMADVDVAAELWDIPNTMLLWSHESSESSAMPLDWYDPPDHPEVGAALGRALDESGTDLVRRFEKWDGRKAEMIFFDESASASSKQRR